MRNPRAKTGNTAALHPISKLELEDLSLQWRTVRKMGPGLVNLGNTCYMNSVLQCLTHTPPLAEALLAGNGLVSGVSSHSTRAHNASSKNNGLVGSKGSADSLASTRAHIEQALRHRCDAISPIAHLRSLRSLSTSFRRGRQEDAHEYLIALLDSMHNMAVGGPTTRKLPPSVTSASLIHQIFAGRICSKVTCTDCGFESNTFDPFLDISLEINRASSVKKALERFTASETLDGSNKYKCPRQNRMVRAEKRMAVEDAPAVLVVQLKRFEFSARSRKKIGKRVDFDTRIDLAPFMAQRKGPVLYDLFGVLVHQGHSLNAGHYVSFVKGPNGLWHLMDDSRVSQVSERIVLGQTAYMLFYVREEVGKNGSTTAVAPRQGSGVDSGASCPPNTSDGQVTAAASQKSPVTISPGSKAEGPQAKSSSIKTTDRLRPHMLGVKMPPSAVKETKRKSLEPSTSDTSPSSLPAKRQQISSPPRSEGPPTTVPEPDSPNQGATPDSPAATRRKHVVWRLRRAKACVVDGESLTGLSPATSAVVMALPQAVLANEFNGLVDGRLRRHLLDHRNRMSLTALLCRSFTASTATAATAASVAATAPSGAASPQQHRPTPRSWCGATEPAVQSRTRTRTRQPLWSPPKGTQEGDISAHPQSTAPDSSVPNSRSLWQRADSKTRARDHISSEDGNDTSPVHLERLSPPPAAALPGVTSSAVNGCDAPAAVTKQQQQQQQRGKVPANTITGAAAATALLERSGAQMAAGHLRSGSSCGEAEADSRSYPNFAGVNVPNRGPDTSAYDAMYDQGKQKKVRKAGFATDGISEASFGGAFNATRHQYGGRKLGRSKQL